MITVPKEVIVDEIELLRRLVPLAGARVVELGCGRADAARRMLERQLVASVTAFEVDKVQHSRNLADPHPGGRHFIVGSAEDIPLPDASCDVVIKLKSLHHGVRLNKRHKSLIGFQDGDDIGQTSELAVAEGA